MTQRSLPFDVCARRHRGNSNSAVANRKLQRYKPNVRERIYAMIAANGQSGMTLREIAAAMNKLPHQISGRLSELKLERRIRQIGERDGFAVYVIRDKREQ
mgnify:CR=1 FL=1